VLPLCFLAAEPFGHEKFWRNQGHKIEQNGFCMVLNG
jgi:hypothetical protein